MAHVAGLFTPVVGDPSAEDLWRRLKKELGVPCEERSNDHVRVATYRSHAEEAVLAPPGEVHAGGFVLGFGGNASASTSQSLVPPWLSCTFDPISRSLTVATDRHGFAHLYLRHLGSITAFCTRAVPLVRLDTDTSMDPCAIGTLLAFEHLLGDRTYCPSVRLLPVGSQLRLTPSAFEMEPTFRYGQIPLEAKQDRARVAQQLISLLQQAVGASFPRGARLVVPLSGGLDSRLIVAAAHEVNGAPETYTFGAGSIEPLPPDVTIARHVAEQLGVKWTFLPLEEDWLATHAEHAALLTDCQLDVIHSIAVVSSRAFPPGHYRLCGSGGDIGLGGKFLRRLSLAMRSGESSEGIAEYLWRSRSRLQRAEWLELIEPACRSILIEGARDSLQASVELLLAQISGSDSRWLDIWILMNRARRFTAHGASLYQDSATTKMPFFEPRFADRILRLDPRLRARGALQAELLHQAFPSMARIPWQKTGKPVARPGMLGTTRYVLGTLGKSPLGASKPFHNLFLALQQSARLQGFFRDLLLDREGLARIGCFDLAVVERLLDSTINGMRDGTPQLGALATLTLAYRAWSTGRI